jgi:hypothetical protein
MTAPKRRRFEQIGLGQRLPSLRMSGPEAAFLSQHALKQFVGGWAGYEAVVESVRLTQASAGRPHQHLQLSGRVYGRHTDGSRRIEVQVRGRDELGACVEGMVCVKLA